MQRAKEMMIKECLNPYLCKEKSKEWAERQEKYQEVNERKLDEFLGIIEREGTEVLDYSSHALYRMKERLLISKEEINEILDLSWVVEGRSNGFILLLYFKRNSRIFPLHLVILRKPGGDYLMKTVYTPLEEIWGADFSAKICFCGKKRLGNNY